MRSSRPGGAHYRTNAASQPAKRLFPRLSRPLAAVTMFGRRKGALADLADIGGRRRARILPEVRVRLRETWNERFAQSQHVMHHEHLTIASGSRADPDGRNRGMLRDFLSKVGGDAFQYEREGTGLLDRGRILEQPLTASGSLARAAALHAMAAHPMNRLWRKADVSHHWDIDVDQASYSIGHRDAALELDRFGATVLDQTAGIAHGLLDTHLVGKKWQIGNDECTPARPHNHPRMVNHLTKRHRQRAVGSLHDHPKAVAHQENVHTHMVEDSREGIVVRRQHRDRRAFSLHSTQVGYPNFFFCHCDAHHTLKVKMPSCRNRQTRIGLRASRRAPKSRLASLYTLRSMHEPKLCSFRGL